MKVQRCKGTRDLSPQDMKVFRLIEGAFRDCCLKWGYEEVRTPTLEYLYLFTATGTLTPSMLNKVYSFLDWDGWSGERVVLRPDGTIPIARYYIEHIPQQELAKLFYIANVFMFEQTGGETRERWQCGAELIGGGSTAADAELTVMALEVLKQLGIADIQIKLCHAGVIRALLAKLELSPAEQARTFDQILDGDAEALARIKPRGRRQGEALSLLLNQQGKSPGFLKNLKALFDMPELAPSLDNFIGIAELLEALGYDYLIDMASGRGFEYYTGIMFQLFKGEEKMGGGGRYDALVPLMGGRDTPASGFALYIDHLMKVINLEQGAEPVRREVLIKAEASQAQKEGLNLAKHLHEVGRTAEVYLGSQRPADFRWVIEVQDKAPRFMVNDQSRRLTFEAQSADQVLTLLGEESGDKDSIA